ncbi:MAG TPA: DUF5350 domain-containing protein [Methanospirillum sp.]|nr:DUF5350 domain-containing protein [Methanospirillum sp.]
MGKTGTTEWNQVRGCKGQIRLVPRKDSQVKKPGPNQRFKAQSTLKKLERNANRARGRDGRAPAKAPARGRGRGGRGGPGQPQDLRTMAARRRITRPKAFVLGPKARSK